MYLPFPFSTTKSCSLIVQNTYLQIFRFIWLGKSAAINGESTSHREIQFEILGLSDVPPEALSYTACLTRYILSDEPSLPIPCKYAGEFDYLSLYYARLAEFTCEGSEEW